MAMRGGFEVWSLGVEGSDIPVRVMLSYLPDSLDVCSEGSVRRSGSSLVSGFEYIEVLTLVLSLDLRTGDFVDSEVRVGFQRVASL